VAVVVVPVVLVVVVVAVVVVVMIMLAVVLMLREDGVVSFQTFLCEQELIVSTNHGPICRVVTLLDSGDATGLLSQGGLGVLLRANAILRCHLQASPFWVAIVTPASRFSWSCSRWRALFPKHRDEYTHGDCDV
jgi:hypothetical protein